MTPIRTILHATDFSELSNTAFEFASALARDYAAKLVIVHVMPPVNFFAPDGVTVPFPVADETDARIRLMAMRPIDPSVEVEHRLLEGDAVDHILKAADECQADLIVMGTHGHTGLTRMLAGSVAENVLRKAICPVLTVRGTREKQHNVATAEPVELAAAE